MIEVMLIGLSFILGIGVGMMLGFKKDQKSPGSSQNDLVVEIDDKDGGSTYFKCALNDDIIEDEIKVGLNRIFNIKEQNE